LKEKTNKLSLLIFSQAPMTSSENPLIPIHHLQKSAKPKMPVFFQIEPRTLSASLEGLN